MKKALLTSCYAILLLTTHAQDKKLLQEFKYRIDHFKALNLQAIGGNNYNQVDFNNINKSTSASLSSNISANFSTIHSTDKILRTSTSYFYSGYGRNKSNTNTMENINNGFSVQPQINILNKWFNKNNFFELGTSSTIGYEFNKSKSNNIKANNENFAYEITLNTGIGIGRLENITDMQNAIWLQKSLTKENCLTSNLTDAQLNLLARSITKANNTRVLDNRKRIEFLLKTVDGYLQQNGLISKTDINYFTSLNDILFFAFNNVRLAGTEKFIRLSPTIIGFNQNDIRNNSINKTNYNNRAAAIDFSIGINKYVPLSLQRQNNFGVKAILNYTDTKSTLKQFVNDNIVSSNESKGELKKVMLDAFYEYAFYPNTRTVISMLVNGTAGYQEAFSQTSFFGTATANVDVSYFINYNTRFIASVGGFYQSNNYTFSNFAINSLQNIIQLRTNIGIQVSL